MFCRTLLCLSHFVIKVLHVLFFLVCQLIRLVQPYSFTLVFYSILVTLVRPYSMYVLTLFRFALVRRNTLLRLVRLCVLYVGILFGFSTSMFYVYVGILWWSQFASTNRTAMFYLCWYFILSQYVGTLSTGMFYVYVAMFFGLRTLVSLVRPSSTVYVGILFRPSHVSALSMAMIYVCWYFIPPKSHQYGQ